MVYNSLTELIGNTPLLKVKAFPGQKADILVKLEYFNPGGSVKDRIALEMIEDAERRGVLKPGATIIEPTSGNTGVGLAWVGRAKGYKVILTMPETMSQERRSLLKALGATLELTPGATGMKGAIAKAEELRDSTPGAVILGQFVNPANPAVHERTTGEEIWRDTEGKVDIFVAGVGTGGTVSGTGKALKKHNPASTRFRASAPASNPPPSTAPSWTRSLRSRTMPPSRLPVSFPPGKAFSWAFPPVRPSVRHSLWHPGKRMPERPSWPCSPTPESAICPPYCTLLKTIRFKPSWLRRRSGRC